MTSSPIPHPPASGDTELPAALVDVLRGGVDAILDTAGGGGWRGGVGAYIRREWNRDLAWAQAPLRRIAEALAEGPDAVSVLAELEIEDASRADVDALVRVCREGFYGGTEQEPPGGWAALGYRPLEERPRAAPRPTPAGIRPEAIRDRYDVVVIGSGPGGGVAAQILGEAGARVLLVERAPDLPTAELRGDHLHGKRMATYRPTAGPGAGSPRIVVEPDGSEWTADGDGSGEAWGLNAMTLGGGTRLWQGMSWRFLDQDFRMASTYGELPGSSLTDWPIDPRELDASYAWAERHLGVAGQTGALTSRMPSHPGYPMPPLPTDANRMLLGAAADRKGWGHGPIPFAINSVPRAGRPACVACRECMGHACPVDAKNGAHNTFVPDALATGAVELLYGAQATRILTAGDRATGVRLALAAQERTVEVSCDRVVVAAGAIETPRLLLASGIGNDHVGRHLHGHTKCLVVGILTHDVPTFRGPGHSVATMDFVHDGSGHPGGGVLFDAFAPYPMQLMAWGDALGAPRWGSGRTAWIGRALGHIAGAMTMGQEIPVAESRVTLDAALTDRSGVPAVRLHRAAHEASGTNLAYLRERCEEWLREAGAARVVDVFAGAPSAGRLSPATEHSAGTVRMGDDPRSSAADRFGLVHGMRNVTVCDGSLHPTNGSVNPTLTLIANAHRVATHLTAA